MCALCKHELRALIAIKPMSSMKHWHFFTCTLHIVNRKQWNWNCLTLNRKCWYFYFSAKWRMCMIGQFVVNFSHFLCLFSDFYDYSLHQIAFAKNRKKRSDGHLSTGVERNYRGTICDWSSVKSDGFQWLFPDEKID